MGWTPLMVASTSGDHFPVKVSVLISLGASGHLEVVTELLNAGADPKTTNEKEQTPLYADQLLIAVNLRLTKADIMRLQRAMYQ